MVASEEKLMRLFSNSVFIFFAIASAAFAKPMGNVKDPYASKPIDVHGDPLKHLEVSPFPGVCQNTVFLRSEWYQVNRQYWDAAKTSCNINVELVPDTVGGGMFKYLAPMIDGLAAREKGADFLESVAKRTVENLEINGKVSELWANCAALSGSGADAAAAKKFFATKLAGAKVMAEKGIPGGDFDAGFYDSSKCDTHLKELKDLIAKRGPETRVAREIMRRTMSGFTKTKEAATGLMREAVDSNIDGLNMFGLGLEKFALPGEKVPLSAEETAEVEKTLKNSDSKARTQLLNLANAESKRLAEYRKQNPNPNSAPFESMVPPAPHWVVEFYKAGGGRGASELPDGAQDKLDIAVEKAVNAEHFAKASQNYTKGLSGAQILAFLNKRDPSNADIASAAKELLKNNNQLLSETRDLIQKGRPFNLLERNVLNMEKAKELDKTDLGRIRRYADLMQNTSVVTDLLKEHPENCAVAIGLNTSFAREKTRNKIALSVGVAAATFGATAAVGPATFTVGGVTLSSAAIPATASIATGGLSVMGDYYKYQGAKKRSFNVVHTDKDTFGSGVAIADSKEFFDARTAFLNNAAIYLAGTVAPSIYKGFIKPNQAKLQSQVVLKKLMANGMTENEGRDLIEAVGKGDKDAIYKLAKEFGVSNSEMEVAGRMWKEQMNNPDTASTYASFSERLNAMKKTPEQRKVLFDRMNEIMKNVEGVGPAKRSDAMRVVIAATELGDYDNAAVNLRAIGAVKDAYKPIAGERLGAVIKGWDGGGLRGLATTLDQARINLTLPEIARLAPEKRQEAAYDKALKDLGVTDPIARAAMKNCGLGAAR